MNKKEPLPTRTVKGNKVPSFFAYRFRKILKFNGKFSKKL